MPGVNLRNNEGAYSVTNCRCFSSVYGNALSVNELATLLQS